MLFLELPIKRYEFCKLKRSADVISDVSTPGSTPTRAQETERAAHRATCGAAFKTRTDGRAQEPSRGNARARGAPFARWLGGPATSVRAQEALARAGAPPTGPQGTWRPTIGALEAVSGPGMHGAV